MPRIFARPDAAIDGSPVPQHAMPPTARQLRAQAVQRLQIGLFGLALMLLLVALANVIMDHARLGQALGGSGAAAHGASGDSDPLADIGVIPSPEVSAPAHGAAAPPRRR